MNNNNPAEDMLWDHYSGLPNPAWYQYKNKTMSKLEIKKCVLEIFDELCDRSGFDDWWYNLGDDIQEEIESSIEKIIKRRFGNE